MKKNDYYIENYKSTLFKLKILSIEAKEYLDFLKKGIDKLKFFIDTKINKFEENEIPRLATSSIKIALFIRYAIENLIYTIVSFNKKSIKIEKSDWKITELIKKLDSFEINWTPKKFEDLIKFDVVFKNKLKKDNYFTSKEIIRIYSNTSKIIHNIRPWYLINKKNNNKKVDFETFFSSRLKIIEKEYNKLNHLHKSFFGKIKNHFLFIENYNYLLTIKDFEIHNEYILKQTKTI